MISLDIFSTMLAAAGVAEPKGTDGVNLLPFLTASDGTADSVGEPHDTLYWRIGHRRALRDGDWKLLSQQRRSGAGEAQAETWELYHLAEDVAEANNLAGQEEHAALKQAMIEKWRKFDAQMMDPVWSPSR